MFLNSEIIIIFLTKILKKHSAYKILSIRCHLKRLYEPAACVPAIIQKTVPDTTALVTLRDKPLGDNDSMPLVQVRCRIRSSQNRIYGSGSIVSGLFNQYLSLLFKVQQTMSGYNPHCCSNDTLLCCVDWDCGSGSDNLVVFLSQNFVTL